MVYNREEAAKWAEASKTNSPGLCQAWTRSMFGAPAVGDVASARAQYASFDQVGFLVNSNGGILEQSVHWIRFR